MKKRDSLGARLRYGFDKSMAAGPIALIGWLAVVSLLIIIAAAAFLAVTRIAPEGGERGLSHVSHHPDNFHPLRLRRLQPDEDALAHGRVSGKGFLRKQIVDHDQAAIRRVIGLTEGAPSQQRRTHGLKISGQHDLEIGCLKLARVSESIAQAPANGTKASRQGKWNGTGNTLYTGDGM